MVDVTNGTCHSLAKDILRKTGSVTNVHMGLGALKDSGQATDSHLVAGENMMDRVDGTRTQQGRPAAASQEVQRTGNARHPGNWGWNEATGTKKRREGEKTR